MNAKDKEEVSNSKATKDLRVERKAIERLEKEHARKERTLAEALLVLKKSRCDFWNG